MVEIEWQTARLGILAVFSALRGQLITWSKVCGSPYLPNTGGHRLLATLAHKVVFYSVRQLKSL